MLVRGSFSCCVWVQTRCTQSDQNSQSQTTMIEQYHSRTENPRDRHRSSVLTDMQQTSYKQTWDSVHMVVYPMFKGHWKNDHARNQNLPPVQFLLQYSSSHPPPQARPSFVIWGHNQEAMHVGNGNPCHH